MPDNSQKLSKMSNAELWALFPIVIREYNADYPIWYAEEELVLAGLIGNNQIERISHIGSTAVPGLLSKPTVDILLEITQDCNVDGLVSILEQNGYICSKQPESPPPHLMFMKGYTLQGFAEKVFHLHVRYGGDWDELYFRDYLRLHPDISQQYGILKSELQQRLEHDRDGYTDAKTDFIKRYTQLAKSKLGVMLNSKNNKCIKMIQLREISQTRPEEIQRLANNHAIAVNLRDTFPYPYTLEDAVTYLDLVVKGELGHVFGIYKDNTFVGCCSVIPQYDIYRINAEIGYWIGEPYWGKGYATEAVKLSVEYAFKELDLLRVYAYIFEYNTASMRVLEKASFEKEAIIKSSIIKEGKVFDEYLYSIRRI